jgi:Arc/MetJ-type ribon-helix-helix transcriptional regulator
MGQVDWVLGWAIVTMMEIRPTPDQEAFIRQAVEAGRIERPEEAVMQGLALWEERERRRIEILCRVDEAENSLTRGEGIAVTP